MCTLLCIYSLGVYIMSLSDTKLRSLLNKPFDSIRVFKDRDSMSVRVSPKGKIVFQYRYRFEGKQRRYDMGVYPALSLSDARKLVPTLRDIEVALGEQAIAKQRAESEKLKIKEQIDAERIKANAIISAQQRVAVKAELAKEQEEILKQQRLEALGMDVLAEARLRAKSAALDPKYVFDETLKAEVKIQTALFNSLGNSRLVPEIVIGAGQGEQNNGSEFMRLLAADAALSLKKRLEKEKK